MFLMAIQAANLTAAAATIFAALVFAAVKAFFLLFFAEVVHGLFFPVQKLQDFCFRQPEAHSAFFDRIAIFAPRTNVGNQVGFHEFILIDFAALVKSGKRRISQLHYGRNPH